jgi:hypothetical protein
VAGTARYTGQAASKHTSSTFISLFIMILPTANQKHDNDGWLDWKTVPRHCNF